METEFGPSRDSFETDDQVLGRIAKALDVDKVDPNLYGGIRVTGGRRKIVVERSEAPEGGEASQNGTQPTGNFPQKEAREAFRSHFRQFLQSERTNESAAAKLFGLIEGDEAVYTSWITKLLKPGSNLPTFLGNTISKYGLRAVEGLLSDIREAIKLPDANARIAAIFRTSTSEDVPEGDPKAASEKKSTQSEPSGPSPIASPTIAEKITRLLGQPLPASLAAAIPHGDFTGVRRMTGESVPENPSESIGAMYKIELAILAEYFNETAEKVYAALTSLVISTEQSTPPASESEPVVGDRIDPTLPPPAAALTEATLAGPRDVLPAEALPVPTPTLPVTAGSDSRVEGVVERETELPAPPPAPTVARSSNDFAGGFGVSFQGDRRIPDPIRRLPEAAEVPSAPTRTPPRPPTRRDPPPLPTGGTLVPAASEETEGVPTPRAAPPPTRPQAPQQPKKPDPSANIPLVKIGKNALDTSIPTRDEFINAVQIMMGQDTARRDDQRRVLMAWAMMFPRELAAIYDEINAKLHARQRPSLDQIFHNHLPQFAQRLGQAGRDAATVLNGVDDWQKVQSVLSRAAELKTDAYIAEVGYLLRYADKTKLSVALREVKAYSDKWGTYGNPFGKKGSILDVAIERIEADLKG